MNYDYKTHYDEAYWTGKKTYVDNNGQLQQYHGPSLSWDGFNFVRDALHQVILPGQRADGLTLLDIGCGGGDLADRFMAFGWDAYGVDISGAALNKAVGAMRSRVALADISERPQTLVAFHPNGEDLDGNGNRHFRLFPDTYDLVLATDLLEHIWEEDIDTTLDWIVSKSSRWLFFCVATAQNPNSPLFVPNKLQFVGKKGEPIPREFEATAISGHVNVRPFRYWIAKFRERNLTVRWDMMYLFQLQREMNTAWKNTEGWNMQTTILVEKARAKRDFVAVPS